MGNNNSSPLQQCLSTAFSGNPGDIAAASNPLYQIQYVKPYNLDLPVTPVAVTRPTDSAQVGHVVKCAADSDVKVQPRSGGHSYGNYGMSVDEFLQKAGADVNYQASAATTEQ